jgi:hypothetical protein
MTLGDIIQEAIKRDAAGKHPEATIECSVPYNGLEEEANYARLYFLSMAFNSAVYGMKRKFLKRKT